MHHHSFHNSQLTGRKTVFLVLAGILLISIAIAIATGVFTGEKSKTIKNTKGHAFSIELSGVSGGTELTPGATQNISPKIDNTSSTETIYVFMKLAYNGNVYSISQPSGWYAVDTAEHLYAYGTANQMTEVAIGGSATLSATLTVKATGSTFEGLTDKDMEVTVTAYGISTAVSRDKPTQAWEDYGTDGNASMLAAIGY